MHTTHLRKVGGSIMLALPPAIIKLLHLQAGAEIGLAVDGNRLVIEPQPRQRYTLEELLAQCDASQPLSSADRQWADTSVPAGRELL
jgi:antitoxin ChpS